MDDHPYMHLVVPKKKLAKKKNVRGTHIQVIVLAFWGEVIKKNRRMHV
jgi:hypothetical protein